MRMEVVKRMIVPGLTLSTTEAGQDHSLLTDEDARAPWPGSQGTEEQTRSELDLSNPYPGPHS